MIINDFAPYKITFSGFDGLDGLWVERAIPRAIVFALVLGWFFMKSRGTERPMAATTSMM